jgi:hypothetical protein
MFTVDGRPITHFLVEDGQATQHALAAAGLRVHVHHVRLRAIRVGEKGGVDFH